MRGLNGTSQISLVTHDAKGEMREIYEVSSGLARMKSGYLKLRTQIRGMNLISLISHTIRDLSKHKQERIN